MVVIIYDERFLNHYSEFYTHPESPSRLVTVLNSLKSLSLMSKYRVVSSVNEVDYDLPYEVHEKNYVELIKTLSSKGFAYVDGDTYVNKHTYDVAVHALSAAVLGHKLCTTFSEPSFVIVRPPGHHAGISGRALGAPTLGFCIFNNVAVLASRLLKEGFRRVVIVDIDAHHGNGTQEIFMNESRVIFVDVHQEGIYPGTGNLYDLGSGDAEGTKVNIPLPAGSGDDVYRTLLNEIIEPLVNEVKPDYVLVSAGYDAYYTDPLTDLRVTAMTYYHYFRVLKELAKRWCGGRLVAVLEGGYADGLSRGVPNSIAALGDDEPYVTEAETSSRYDYRQLVGRVKEVLKRYWNLS